MEVKRLDLISQLMEKHNYTKAAATDVVDDFTDIILDNLRDGNTVSIYGFGTFSVVERAQRSCPDPQTRETIVIPAHYVPKFTPGQTMKTMAKMLEDDVKRGLI